MSSVTGILFVVGYGLLVAALSTAAVDLARRRGRHRLDVVFFISLLLVIPVLRPTNVPLVYTLRLVAIALLPYGVVRLVGHLRDVPGALTRVTLGVPAAIGVLALILPNSAVAVGLDGVALYILVVMGLAAGAITREAVNAVGVSKRRLWFAAFGTAALGMASGGRVAAALVPATLVSTRFVSDFAQGFSLICYYLAFATPRPFLDRWRRAEQASYLARTSEREPEERGRLAGDDLFEASVRCIGGATTCVATRAQPTDSRLTVRAASDPALVGTELLADRGLIGRALNTNVPISGSLADCGEDLAGHVKPAGGQALVAPIGSTSNSWGVVFVLHRPGALFPDDDLAMLAQLARTAAVALDHAHLVVERRERERQIADRRLRELESRVGLMLDSIKDYAMLLVDDAGRVAAWHHGAQHLFGYRSDEITDRSAAPMYDVSVAEYHAWLAEARTRGYAERDGPCRRSDGSTFVGTTIVRPLVTEPDEPPGFVVVTHDVTERRNLEDRLRQGQKMEAIGQLAGGVAHDFNNLLTAILGYADWLDRDLAGDPRREQVSEIQKAAERAADLTRQLLAFSRRQMLHLASVDLSRLVGELVPMLRRLIGEQIEIVEATVSLGSVHGDRSQLEQVVLNLAVNARDAMPAGGRLTIRTEDVLIEADDGTVPPGSYVRLEVQDTGIGMSSETRRRAFEPFFTTKEVGRGTGLGLSTVYGIVQQMNGLVEVESEADRGTTFRLYFPMAEAAAGTPASDERASGDRGQGTLLLVEDDEAVRSYLAGILESNGYRVLAADHPRTALALTEQSGQRIDLVISDVVMPGSTGPELVRLLGQVQPGMSALFISGYGRDELAPIAGSADAHLLQKPFSSSELLTRVREILSAA